MKSFNIGQLVQFDHIAEGQYEGDDRKVVDVKIATMCGIVCGKKVVAEGIYCKGSNGGYSPGSWLGVDEYEPPTFTTTKNVYLWEVRTSWLGRPLLVSDQHLQLMPEANAKRYKFPNLARKPERIEVLVETP